MKKIIFTLIGILVSTCSTIILHTPPNTATYEDALFQERWEKLIWAITEVESGGNDFAKNPRSSALGRFQQLKIYVDDVNRIVGSQSYSYNDRTDSVKAREMFDIIQQHYNPKKDLDRAIRLHRGLHDPKYVSDIYELINNS